MDHELINTFKSAISSLKEIEDRTTAIDHYSRLIRNNEEKMVKEKRPGILWIFPTLLITAIILDPLTCPVYDFLVKNTKHDITFAGISVIIILLTMIIIWNILKAISWMPKHNKMIKDYNSQNQKFQIQIELLNRERQDIYSQNEALLSKLPQDHLTSQAISSLYNILVNKRADNIKDAIAIYTNDMLDQPIISNPPHIEQVSEKESRHLQKKFKKQHAMM